MNTIVLPVDSLHPDATSIVQAAEVLRRGGLVAFPTETVYGLGANALDAAAVARIFTTKGRPARNPIIVHVPDRESAKQLVAAWPETADRLAERFWPGPLSLVLARREMVPDIVTAGGSTVAVRVPAHPVALALLRAAQVPLAAPSANRSSRLSPTLAGHVLADLEGRVNLLLDGGPTSGGIESTVLDLTGPMPRVLRPGLVSSGEIAAVVGPVLAPGADAPAGVGPLRSPGLLDRHYAPRAVLECLERDDGQRARDLCRVGTRVGWLTFRDESLALPGLVRVVMPAEPKAYAARLYAVLHELDASGVERILVTLPPEEDAWLGVRDRLRRAAAPPLRS